MGGVALAHAVVGDRLLAVLAHRHALAIHRVAGDRRIDGLPGGEPPLGNGQVFALDLAGLQRLHQRRVGFQGPRHYHHAAGVLVQPMHDAGARQLLQAGIAVQQAVEQGAAGMTRRRMHHQPGRLVDDKKLFVLVEQAELDGLRPVEGLRALRDVQIQPVADRYLVFGPGHRAVEQHLALADPALLATAREIGQQAVQRLVQAQSVLGGPDDQLLPK